jgi:hypothetical protein
VGRAIDPLSVVRYSDNAYVQMKDALDDPDTDMDDIWRKHGHGRRSKSSA